MLMIIFKFLEFIVKKTSNSSIGYMYVTIQHSGLDDSIQSSQEHITSGHTIYITAADSMIQDYTGSKLSRNYSDSYLLNGSFTSQTVDSTGELFFYSQIHSPANSNSSQFYSRPHIPQNVDDHLP